ncbi:rhodanese-like domain-containing protein [Hymenobacter sp. B81]|uniref:rhodanese-like domain-containing protein n=1 Tax=Hymenobacter sp. B81 TaxID=3344878 RepID=UPI0037DD3093
MKVGRRNPINPLLGGLLALAGCSQDAPSGAGIDPVYEQLLRRVYRADQPVIRPAELAQLLRADSGFILLDTRSAAEYAVSHLRGARHLDPATATEAAVRGLPRHGPLIVYCSVGLRSQQVGEKLRALGFRDVRNLHGGIFQWTNEGRPLYDARGLTARIHPYSALWGIWLKRGQPAYQ